MAVSGAGGFGGGAYGAGPFGINTGGNVVPATPGFATSAPLTATIIYRQLNANGDPIWGQGTANFLTDADAVAQAILTTLRLFEGEWWANMAEGTPMWQQILGVGAPGQRQQQISLILQQRILAVPYVTSLAQVQAAFNPNTRQFTFYCVANTAFGPVTVSNIPTPPPQGVPSVQS